MRSRLVPAIALFVGCAALHPTAGSAQYPANQGSYPPPTQQYPPPQQGPYPQQGQYPPQGGQYPPQAQYPPPNSYPQQPYPATGQYPPSNYPQPVPVPPQQLDSLVSRIALYPDGLLAQVLTASTYGNEIPDAATWALQHQGWQSDQLARAISEDRLPFDPSVLALLPFPSILDQMARDPNWTQQLGSAVLVQRNDVMDVVQRLRDQAYQYGYLRSNPYESVTYSPGYVVIQPVNPGAYYVPYYNPLVVYRRPRPGFFAGSAIRFGPAITIGAGFSPFGWSGAGFGWREHNILIDRRPWVRTWSNRAAYVPPAAYARPRYEGPRVERHDIPNRGREFHDRDGHDRGHER